MIAKAIMLVLAVLFILACLYELIEFTKSSIKARYVNHIITGKPVYSKDDSKSIVGWKK